jgi:hypothetical protein
MKWFRRLWPYALLVLLIAANVTVWIQRDRIADWWRLRDYEPSKDVAVLVKDTSMTGWGEHLFYVNHPSLESRTDFNKHCSDHGEETAVLGCYHGNRRGIYLYAVTDPRLEGVRQVTAAHEMLHQAYDRLSTDERERIGKLLQDYYDTRLADEDVRTKIESYREDGADLANEMHSILGTEVRELTPELETYYKKYFKDRSKVVASSEAYQSEFKRRKELSEQYATQLEDLKKQFDSNKSELNTKQTFLKDKKKDIDSALAANDRVAYEAAITAYNDMVRAYNDQLNQTRQIIDEYNRTSDARKEVALQQHELYEALDSLGPAEQEQ